MEEQKLTHKPHVGAKPVKAEPNRDKERALKPSNPPKELEDEVAKAPEATTREKTAESMGDATSRVEDKLHDAGSPPYATEQRLNDEQANQAAEQRPHADVPKEDDKI